MIRFIACVSILLFWACSSETDDAYPVGAGEPVTLAAASPMSTVVNQQYDTFYDDNGNVQKEIVYLNEEKRNFFVTSYYPNGNVEEVLERGEFDSCPMQVGEHFQYAEDGTLLSIKTYEHFKGEDYVGCHDTRTVIRVTEFYPGEKIKKTYAIETCYECVSCPCGEAVTYNEEGEEVFRKSFGPCDDGLLGCIND